MESSILSEVDDTSILRTGLPTPLCLSSQLATGLSPRAPRSGLERSDFVLGTEPRVPERSEPVRYRRASPVRGRPGDGLLTEQIADARGCCRELVLMPHSGHPGSREALRDGNSVRCGAGNGGLADTK